MKDVEDQRPQDVLEILRDTKQISLFGSQTLLIDFTIETLHGKLLIR